MRFCCDASAVLAWLLPDERTPIVEGFWTALSHLDELIGPQMLLPECSSTLRERVYLGLIPHDEAMRLTAELLDLPIRISSAPQQFTRALELANQTRRIKSFDMQYVAVAEVEHGELVTLDGGIRQAAIENRVPVRLLR